MNWRWRTEKGDKEDDECKYNSALVNIKNTE